MPTISNHFDLSGRPLIELYAAMSDDEAASLRAVGIPPPTVRQVVALVNTGAGRSQLDLDVIRELGLSRTGEIEVYTASTGGSPILMDLYRIDLASPGDSPGPFATSLEVVGSPFLASLRVGMLLGRDALGHCLLTYDGPNHRFDLIYRG